MAVDSFVSQIGKCELFIHVHELCGLKFSGIWMDTEAEFLRVRRFIMILMGGKEVTILILYLILDC